MPGKRGLLLAVILGLLLLCVPASTSYPAPLELTSPHPRVLSTIYYPGDGMSGKKVGCSSAAKRLYGTDNFAALVRKGVPVVATRGKRRPYRCGQRLLLYSPRTERFTIGLKLDTGPWSCYRPGLPRITTIREIVGCSRRSFIDITPAVAEQLGHSGLERLHIWGLEEG